MPRQDSQAGKAESALPKRKKDINLLNTLEHWGKHLLRRYFGDWADIELYQVWDMFEVSGWLGSNKYRKGHSRSEVGEGVLKPPGMNQTSGVALFQLACNKHPALWIPPPWPVQADSLKENPKAPCLADSPAASALPAPAACSHPSSQQPLFLPHSGLGVEFDGQASGGT